MAPMIANSKTNNDQAQLESKDLKNQKKQLLLLRKYIEKNFKYVGKDFGKKIRELYYDKKSNKAIYGTTTLEERAELADEGIDLLSIPWVDKEN